MYQKKEVYFPEIKSFKELFNDYQFKHINTKAQYQDLGGGCHCSTHLSIMNTHTQPHFLYVELKPEIFKPVIETMYKIYNDNDHISLEAVVRDDGTALIIVSYNQIIGSRWIAVIDASTIPTIPKDHMLIQVRNSTEHNLSDVFIIRKPKQMSGWEKVQFKDHSYKLKGVVHYTYIDLSEPTGRA